MRFTAIVLTLFALLSSESQLQRSGLTFTLTTLPALAFAAPIPSEREISKRGDCPPNGDGCRMAESVSVSWRFELVI